MKDSPMIKAYRNLTPNIPLTERDFERGEFYQPQLDIQKKLDLIGFDKSSIILFFGMIGVGKTTELQYFQWKCKKEGNTSIILHDISDYINLEFLNYENFFEVLKAKKEEFKKLYYVRENYPANVVIIDGLDRSNTNTIVDIFIDYADELRTLKIEDLDKKPSLIFTLPLSCLYTKKFAEKYSNKYSDTNVLILSPYDIRQENYRKWLSELALKRLGDNLIQEDLLEQFVIKSGGIIRNLLSLLRGAVDYSYTNNKDTITESALEYAVNGFKFRYTNMFTDKEWEELEKINSDIENFQQIKGIDTYRYIELEAVMAHHNLNISHTINPIVKELLTKKLEKHYLDISDIESKFLKVQHLKNGEIIVILSDNKDLLPELINSLELFAEGKITQIEYTDENFMDKFIKASEQFDSVVVVSGNADKFDFKQFDFDRQKIKLSSLIIFWLSPNDFKKFAKAPNFLSFVGYNVMLLEDRKRYITKEQLEDDLKYYEKKYGVSSDEFYQKWIKGEFEDNHDTNRWSNIYYMYLKMEGKK